MITQNFNFQFLPEQEQTFNWELNVSINDVINALAQKLDCVFTVAMQNFVQMFAFLVFLPMLQYMSFSPSFVRGVSLANDGGM